MCAVPAVRSRGRRVSGHARLGVLALVCTLLPAARAGATVYTVAASGGDFTTIQAALNAAVAGDTIQVRAQATPYFEKLVFPASGDAGNGPITLEAYPGEQPIVDGTGVPGANLILIDDRSWITVRGLVLRNDLGVSDGSGIRVLGTGSHIELRDNEIHDVRGSDAMGITVYGTAASPISDLVVDGNVIHDCEPARSEALTVNGNVTDFAITNNVVRDVNNIGIDMIGGETDIQPNPTLVARNGVVRGNTVIRANSVYGGGYAGGIYVDGGRDIVIERNVVTGSDLGIEIGAENAGIVTSGVIVRDNVVYANEKVGIVFGGYAASAGRVKSCAFLNNSLYGNDTLGEGLGELWIQYAEDNVVRNNVLFSTAQNVLVYSESGNVDNALDYNLFFTAAGAGAAELTWQNVFYQGFAAYQAGTGQDAHSLFADPQYVDPGGADFHLTAPGSPAINAGDPAFVAAPGEVDIDGGARVNGPRVDVGTDEAATCGNGTVELPEGCDDGCLVGVPNVCEPADDGDGCDSNCTPTGCGNGIVTTGEDCDDGGDCCAASCVFEGAGAACDDGDACTIADACDGAGACAGAGEPEPTCRTALKGALQLRDRVPDIRDVLTWKWTKGAATTVGDFGDPVNGATRYDLCVYDRDGGATSVVMHAAVPPGGTCKGKPCWKAAGAGAAHGYRYTDRLTSADGVKKIVLKPGADGKTSIVVKGKGSALDMPALPLAQDTTVTAQLKSSGGVCWGTVYAAPAVKNESEQFKDTYKAAN
jgi:Right handed beta helix region